MCSVYSMCSIVTSQNRESPLGWAWGHTEAPLWCGCPSLVLLTPILGWQLRVASVKTSVWTKACVQLQAAAGRRTVAPLRAVPRRVPRPPTLPSCLTHPRRCFQQRSESCIELQLKKSALPGLCVRICVIKTCSGVRRPSFKYSLHLAPLWCLTAGDVSSCRQSALHSLTKTSQ